MNLELTFAPIQGITDYVFRNEFTRHFGGINKYYAPYLRIDNEKKFKNSKLKDILPENNVDVPLIPQIMTNNPEDFIFMANCIFDLGYNEINWNLGCPYPMVTNRKLGAGLLPHHGLILSILNTALPKTKAQVSLKFRTGLNNGKDLEQILPKLNDFPLSEIIIHPRYAKQLYKEKADLELFKTYISLTNHRLCYNGDIDTIETFNTYSNNLKIISNFMLGRGLIRNPFLINDIRHKKTMEHSIRKEKFEEFHNSLYNSYIEKLNDKNHVLNRMKGLWVYFSDLFCDNKKVNKRIKKSTNLTEYENAIKDIFCDYNLLN